MNRRILAAAATVVGLMFVLGAAAWACTPQTIITQLRPLSGPAGTMLSIGGSTPTPVEIRWNSADGPVLTSASGPQFSVSAAIPANAKPGVYYLLSNGRALETFQVTSAGQAASPQPIRSDLWAGFDRAPAKSLGAEAARAVPGPSSRNAGVALLAIGLVASFSAVAVFGAKRGRSKVSAKG